MDLDVGGSNPLIHPTRAAPLDLPTHPPAPPRRRAPSLTEDDLDTLTAAIGRDPADAALRVRRAVVHAAAARADLAIADLDAAVALSPGDAGPRVLRARVWWSLAEEDEDEHGVLRVEALADLDRAVAADPLSAVPRRERGVLLHRMRCAEEAVEDLRDAAAQGAEGWHGHTWHAAAACGAGLFEEALAAAGRATAAPDADAAAWYWKAAALVGADDLAAAESALDEALARDPALAVALSMRAQLRRERGDAAGAVEDLTRAIELEPRNDAAHLQRAEAWAALGDERRADDDYARGVLLRGGEDPEDPTMAKRKLVYLLLREHFGDAELDDLAVHERSFPRRVRADLQQALDALPGTRFRILGFTGIASEHDYSSPSFARISKRTQHDPVTTTAPQWEDVDVGAAAPVRCVVAGLWLLEADGVRLAMLLVPPSERRGTGHHFQIAVPDGGAPLADELFGLLETAVAAARCYRGKVLSLETCRSDYSGRATGIAVHRLPPVTRDEVILPEATLRLLERNVFDFVERRERLRELRLSTKKGLLFYGPPGTGKTHTIRYLASVLVGQTTLLVTASQVALLDEYMILARLLQPSIVVLEDVDLFARDREDHDDPGTESLLNRLLNEMDGLRPDADVLFVLTTNRPEALERALASRPGRIDQAIEFPRPDDACRRRLATLYAGGLDPSPDVLDAVVARTEGASASFVRELMRRAAQFMLTRQGGGRLVAADVEFAAREMVEDGGSLNRALLGA